MIRTATLDDLATLCELEKAASTAGLSHVFAELPFPDEDVLARWSIVLEDPRATVLLDEHDGLPIGYAAMSDSWLRHFGMLPDWWGTGRAQLLHQAAIDAMSADGAVETNLWVLVDNLRARCFYERLGWRDAGVRDTEVFEPFPVKMQMVRPAAR
jgi:GNAT superfamily N-acetyltransferase